MIPRSGEILIGRLAAKLFPATKPRHPTMKLPISHLVIASLALATAPLSFAGHEITDKKEVVEVFNPFEKGNHEFQLGIGGYVSFLDDGNRRPELNTVDVTGRLGWMLYTPTGGSILRGNVEFLIEGSVGAVVTGPGDIIADIALLLRYNFVQPSAKFVPYIQIGAGFAYCNAYTDQTQGLIGEAFEFNLQGAIGARYLFSERCGAFIEGGWRHVSNAGLASRNLGLNSLGGLVGFSVFY